MKNNTWEMPERLQPDAHSGTSRKRVPNAPPDGASTRRAFDRNDPRYARYRRKRSVSSTQLTKFEDRLARSILEAWETELIALARSIARRDGTVDMHVLASRLGNPLHVIRRRRARLEARGLWPWLTDKSRVGPPRREQAGTRRSAREIERRKQEIREAWQAVVAARECAARNAVDDAACSQTPETLRDVCRRYLDEFQQLRNHAPVHQADGAYTYSGATCDGACRKKATITSN